MSGQLTPNYGALTSQSGLGPFETEKALPSHLSESKEEQNNDNDIVSYPRHATLSSSLNDHLRPFNASRKTDLI